VSHWWPRISSCRSCRSKYQQSAPPDVTLPALDSLGAKYSGGDRRIAKHVDTHGFWRYLLFLRIVVRDLRLPELGLALGGAVVVDEHDLVVEDCIQRTGVLGLVRLVPGFLQCGNLDRTAESELSCALTNRTVPQTPIIKEAQSHGEASSCGYGYTVYGNLLAFLRCLPTIIRGPPTGSLLRRAERT